MGLWLQGTALPKVGDGEVVCHNDKQPHHLGAKQSNSNKKSHKFRHPGTESSSAPGSRTVAAGDCGSEAAMTGLFQLVWGRNQELQDDRNGLTAKGIANVECKM